MTSQFEGDIKYLQEKNSFQDKVGLKIASLGFTPVPNALFIFRKMLKITYSDILFIGWAIKCKQGNSMPYFSLAKLSRKYGIPSDTSNNIVKRLKSKGYIRVIPRNENPKGKGRNTYDLSPLFDILETLIDKFKDKLYRTDKWTLDEALDFALSKGYEKDARRQKQRTNDVKTREDNKR